MLQTFKSLLLPGIIVNIDGTVEVWKVTPYEEIAMKAYILALAKALKYPKGKEAVKYFIGKKNVYNFGKIKTREIFKKIIHGRFASLLKMAEDPKEKEKQNSKQEKEGENEPAKKEENKDKQQKQNSKDEQEGENKPAKKEVNNK